ncbi:hypothetical protein PT974_01883 [Cladobotryum mycophilum]|uniref:Zn(2)-C6 fungal-type domain-containing protein n=1 Tax=Cladobotryum mycophilum TaxID=491253 RepID=A0ABR0SWM0_9HYPO
MDGHRKALALAIPQTAISTRACEKCTRSKRKCDKALPECGRCYRLNASCVYDYVAPQPRATSSRSKSGSQDGFRLDDGAVDGSENDVLEIKKILSSHEIDWRPSVRQYYYTVHNWFKIISQDKLQEIMLLGSNDDQAWIQMQNADWQADLDTKDTTTLLIVCMHLLIQMTDSSDPENSIFCSIYRATKRAFATLSCLATPTIELVQCGAMLCLFEFGHSRSRFAYRTLSETVAMARIAGLKPGKYVGDLETKSDGNGEGDGGSVWWGLFILDQYIHLDPAMNDLPLILESPQEDDLLPMESVIWDGQSHQIFARKVPITVPFSVPLGSFQRAAQASTTLHRAHLWDTRVRQEAKLSPVADFAHIDRTIRSLLDALLIQCPKWEVFCDAFAMCMSSIFILYRPYLVSGRKTTPEFHLEESPVDTDVEQAAATIKFAIQMAGQSCAPAAISCCQAAQQVFALNDRLADPHGAFMEIYKALKIFSKRWKVGGQREPSSF